MKFSKGAEVTSRQMWYLHTESKVNWDIYVCAVQDCQVYSTEEWNYLWRKSFPTVLKWREISEKVVYKRDRWLRGKWMSSPDIIYGCSSIWSKVSVYTRWGKRKTSCSLFPWKVSSDSVLRKSLPSHSLTIASVRAFRLPAFPITETLESCSRGWLFEWTLNLYLTFIGK